MDSSPPQRSNLTLMINATNQSTTPATTGISPTPYPTSTPNKQPSALSQVAPVKQEQRTYRDIKSRYFQSLASQGMLNSAPVTTQLDKRKRATTTSTLEKPAKAVHFGEGTKDSSPSKDQPMPPARRSSMLDLGTKTSPQGADINSYFVPFAMSVPAPSPSLAGKKKEESSFINTDDSSPVTRHFNFNQTPSVDKGEKLLKRSIEEDDFDDDLLFQDDIGEKENTGGRATTSIPIPMGHHASALDDENEDDPGAKATFLPNKLLLEQNNKSKQDFEAEQRRKQSRIKNKMSGVVF